MSEEWIKINSKYANTCLICNDTITIDESILWKKGEGVKHEDCKPKPLITPEEWLDYQTYSLKQLSKIKNCQCCGITLDITKDTYINCDRKTCDKCFSK